jgi:hypothetical protein
MRPGIVGRFYDGTQLDHDLQVDGSPGGETRSRTSQSGAGLQNWGSISSLRKISS